MNEILSKLIKEELNRDTADVLIEYQNDGLTNQNFIISSGNKKYVIRIGGKNSAVLGINRYAEYAVMKAVAKIGVGADLIYFSTETGNMITEYIEGRKWCIEDVTTSENIKRIAGTLKKVHSLPPIPYVFSPYKDIEDRIQYARQNALELPDYLDKILEKLSAIKLEREKNLHENFGLCHNDPFPNNFLEDGTVRLIDWEYGGMGDIFFDLASVSMFYSQSQKEELLKYYFGEINSKELTCLNQMSFVVSFWNAMWAVVQSKLPYPEFDYKEMAKNIFLSILSEIC